VIFVRLKGRNNSVRELLALLDPASDYCVLPKPDAFRLGYPEAAHDDPITTPPNLLTAASMAGYTQSMLIKMKQVWVGGIESEEVDFLAFDLPQSICYDAILGKSFLKAAGVKLEMDYAKKELRIMQEKNGS
jgi:predicted aspartyl protease